MEFLEARRLTGPNVLWDKESAILDVSCTAEEADRLIPYCENQVRVMLDAVGWRNESITHVRLAGGVSIAFSAPIDALYAASSIAEWAWACCDTEFNDAPAPDFSATVTEISDAIAEEIKTQSDSCVQLSKQIVHLAEDFDLDGIQKLADALDAS